MVRFGGFQPYGGSGWLKIVVVGAGSWGKYRIFTRKVTRFFILPDRNISLPGE